MTRSTVWNCLIVTHTHNGCEHQEVCAMSRSKKPIKIFYSELSGRLYASQHYKITPTAVVITGEKSDVTNDIGAIIHRHNLEFTEKEQS